MLVRSRWAALPPILAGLLLTGCGSGDAGAGGPTPDGGPDGGPIAQCGNGVLDPGEECDDGGNTDRFDGCLPGCVAWEIPDEPPIEPSEALV